MNRFTQITSSLLIAAQALTAVAPAFAANAPDPLAQLKIPAGSKLIAKGYVDNGVQRNECVLKDGKYVFESRGPLAPVKDRPGGRTIIFHAAEPNGRAGWTDLKTGNRIVAVPEESIPPSDPTQIAKVKLKVEKHLGPKGKFSPVDFVVRPNPVGGGAAAKTKFTGPEFCDKETVGQVKESWYSTEYDFEQNPSAKGQTVRRKIAHTISRARAAVTRRRKAPVAHPRTAAAESQQQRIAAGFVKNFTA